jgi:glycosyltransferase involved in cell wall biosynthesis
VAPHGSLEEYILNRSPWKKQLASLAYQSENLRCASCLHATSSNEAASFRRYGLTNPVAVISDGIPDAWLQSQGNAARFRARFSIRADQRLLIFLSRIHPKKGLPLLLEALARLCSQLANWSLFIAGPDEAGHQHELELLAAKLGVGGMIRFVGPLFGQDKRDAIAAADLFVLPTHSENFGIVVAEALGAGVPVLTTRGAPWEEIQTWHCGWWVDTSVIAIQEALLDATQRSKKELTVMGQHGKELVAQRYTWPRVAEQSVLLYQWLLGRSERPNFMIAR